MTLFASHFLTGAILSLLMPVVLLLVLQAWFWYAGKRVGDEVERDRPRPSTGPAAGAPSAAVAGGTAGPSGPGGAAGGPGGAAGAGGVAGAEPGSPAGP